MTTVEALAKMIDGETIKRNDCTDEEWTFDATTGTVTETDGEFHIYMNTDDFLTYQSDEWHVAKKIMKVFISQPMRGKDATTIEAERNTMTIAIRATYGTDVEIVDSYVRGAPGNAKPLWFLGRSLELLSNADAVAFAEDWKSARGCRIEHEAAESYGIKILCD